MIMVDFKPVFQGWWALAAGVRARGGSVRGQRDVPGCGSAGEVRRPPVTTVQPAIAPL